MAGNLETGFTGRDMMRTDVVNAVLEKVRGDSPDRQLEIWCCIHAPSAPLAIQSRDYRFENTRQRSDAS